MKQDNTITLKTLSTFFNYFNEKIFDNKLPITALIITNYKKKNTLGYFKPLKNVIIDKKETYEIGINYYHFNKRSNYEMLGTLLHEMVHLYCHINNIKDTSKNGRHLKVFQTECNNHGLKCKKINVNMGFAFTELSDSTIELIDKFWDNKIHNFNLSIVGEPVTENDEIDDPKQSYSLNKYACMECEANFKCKLELTSVTCECGGKMIKC